MGYDERPVGKKKSAEAGCKPKDEEVEVEPEEEEEKGKLHVANPLLCPAKEGGRHRGKEISEEGSGRGFVPEFVPGFVPLKSSTAISNTLELPDSSWISKSTRILAKIVRRQFANKFTEMTRWVLTKKIQKCCKK